MTAFNKTSFMFKIRRKRDGLYSSGGAWPHFSAEGKTWKKKSGLSNHLFNVYSSNAYEPKSAFEVVEIEVKEEEADSMGLDEYISIYNDKKLQAAQALERAKEEREKKKRFEEFKKLKCEFEGDC